MKRILILMMVLITLSAQIRADVIDGNKIYMACDTCVSNADFKQHAAASQILGGPSTFIIVNTTNHSSFDDINHGVVKKVVKTGGFPLGEPEFNIQALSSHEQNLYDSYINYLKSYNEFYNFTTPEMVGKVNIPPSLTPNMNWVGNTDFATEYKNVFNSAVNQTYMNPFFFTKKSLTIQVATTDGFIIELYRHYSLYQTSWHILKSTDSNGVLVDNNGNAISPRTIHQQSEFCSPDLCEMSCQTINASSGAPTSVLPLFEEFTLTAVCSDDGGKPVPPTPYDPTPTLPGCTPLSCPEPVCNGENCPVCTESNCPVPDL